MIRSEPHGAATPGPVALNSVITANLEKLLSSTTFSNAASLRELLRFTVHETLAGRGRELKEYLLATAVLGKAASFDPKADPIVRVQMRRVRDRLNRYYATEGRFDSIVVEIPSGTYMPRFRSAVRSSATPIMAARETFMVGRQKELSELRYAFESAADGYGLLFCLCGEPGIGKTTVVEAFLRELATSGVGCYIVRGRCSERLSGSEAYLPVLEALETLLSDGEARRLMSALAPTWYVQVAPRNEDPLSDGILAASRVASQERLKRELVVFFDELGRRQPVVLFLDDLHWADGSTSDVLSYLANRSGLRRLLIVGTYRPSELQAANHPLVPAKLELQARGLCRELSIEFLTGADIDSYLALQFPEHRFPPELSSRILSRTEGNPLFMVDLVRLLQDRGVFIQREGYWVLARQLPDLEQQLPESVRSMIQKKIGQLSDADRRLMTAAAVQGQEFDSAVVARALQIDPTEAEDRLEALDRTHGLVRLIGDLELPDSTLTLSYAFVHVLYQNAFQNAITGTRKAGLSLRVAEAVAHFYRDSLGEVASQLALLSEAGRDFAWASDFFLTAARNAGRVYAAHEAIALAHRSIANAEKLKGNDRHRRVIAAALHSAEQQESLTRFDEAIADFELAERAAVELGDVEAQVDAICGKADSLFVAKRITELNELGVRALEMARAVGSDPCVASSNIVLALEPFGTGDLTIAKERFDSAIPVLQQRDRSKHAVDACCFRGVIHSHRLEHREANLDFGWAYERALELGLNFELLIALFHRARTRANEGRLYEAAELLNEAERLADLVAERFWRPRIANTQGWFLTELFDTASALRLNTEAAHMAQEFGDVEAECMSHINAARNYLLLDEPDRAAEHLRAANGLYERDVWFRWIYYPRMQAEWASYWIARGDLTQALSHARISLAHAERTQSRKRIAWAHKLLGDIAALEDRPGEADREFKTALHLLERHSCPIIEWQILVPAAAAADMLGERAERDELLGRARQVVHMLADSLHDDKRRGTFLNSKPIRELLH